MGMVIKIYEPTCTDLAREVDSDFRFRAPSVAHWVSKVDRFVWFHAERLQAIEFDEPGAREILDRIARDYPTMKPEVETTP